MFSGGLFQNVALNRRLVEYDKFDEVFIPMAPSDSGLSLGAALFAKKNTLKNSKFPKSYVPKMTPF